MTLAVKGLILAGNCIIHVTSSYFVHRCGHYLNRYSCISTSGAYLKLNTPDTNSFAESNNSPVNATSYVLKNGILSHASSDKDAGSHHQDSLKVDIVDVLSDSEKNSPRDSNSKVKQSIKNKLVYISLNIGEHDLDVKKKMIKGYLEKGLYVTVKLKANKQMKRLGADIEQLQNSLGRRLSDEYDSCATINRKKSTVTSIQFEPLHNSSTT